MSTIELFKFSKFLDNKGASFFSSVIEYLQFISPPIPEILFESSPDLGLSLEVLELFLFSKKKIKTRVPIVTPKIITKTQINVDFFLGKKAKDLSLFLEISKSSFKSSFWPKGSIFLNIKYLY